MSQSIFLKELYAVVWWIESTSQSIWEGNAMICIATDNTATAHVIQRGLSTVRLANEFLKRIFARIAHDRIEMITVRSEDNAADPLTRERVLDPERNQRTFLSMESYFKGHQKIGSAEDFIMEHIDGRQDRLCRHEEFGDDFASLFPSDLFEEHEPTTARQKRGRNS